MTDNVQTNKKKDAMGEGCNIFFTVAAIVTAYTRMFLLSDMRQAYRENLNYSDTDSLSYNPLVKGISPFTKGFDFCLKAPVHIK